MPETETQLTESDVADIESMAAQNTGPRAGYTHQLCESIRALIRDLRALRAERLEIQRLLASTALQDPTEDDDPPYSTVELVQGVRYLIHMKDAARQRTVALRKQLAQATYERDMAIRDAAVARGKL